MKKPELLLPAGNEDCLRAAVNNGADAVYLGLDRFSARKTAGKFNKENIASIIDYCHKRKVKVYVALNTLVKNSELKDYFDYINIAYSAGANAIIIQDYCLIPIIKKNFPDIKIHLSTQATTTNSFSIPKDADRIILARELSLEEIKNISKDNETEIFVHGALCLSYSGQCLFSSIVGGRSGNRGCCAQPCRKIYNNKYLLSTMDLCMLEKIPELIKAGASCFKIEGRMRSPLYVAAAARIYRKAIDSYFNNNFSINERDIAELKLAFNREFTKGFAFSDSITDSRKPMNRGLYVGNIKENKLHLKSDLKIGDGVGIWMKNKVIGFKIEKIIKEDKEIKQAKKGDVVDIGTKGLKDDCPVYKTSSADLKLDLGDEIKPIKKPIKAKKIVLPEIKEKENKDNINIIAKVYNEKSALAADKAKADIIYYDILKKDCKKVKEKIKNSEFFVFTPRILSDKEIEGIIKRIKEVNPAGVLVGNKGLLNFLKDYKMHLDYSFNCFSDIDLDYLKKIPIISPELNLKEISGLKNKNFIILIHGDIILMTTKENIKAPELIDEEGRRFKVRKNDQFSEILNSKQLGLFNLAKKYLDIGIKYFLIDTNKDVDKFIRIYRKIFDKKPFDDSKIKKGYTTAHLSRGVD